MQSSSRELRQSCNLAIVQSGNCAIRQCRNPAIVQSGNRAIRNPASLAFPGAPKHSRALLGTPGRSQALLGAVWSSLEPSPGVLWSSMKPTWQAGQAAAHARHTEAHVGGQNIDFSFVFKAKTLRQHAPAQLTRPPWGP